MADIPTHFNWNRHDYERGTTVVMQRVTVVDTVCIADHKAATRKRIINTYNKIHDKLARHAARRDKHAARGNSDKVRDYNIKIAKLAAKAPKSNNRIQRRDDALYKVDVCVYPVVVYNSNDNLGKLDSALAIVKGTYYYEVLQGDGWTAGGATVVYYFEDAGAATYIKMLM